MSDERRWILISSSINTGAWQWCEYRGLKRLYQAVRGRPYRGWKPQFPHCAEKEGW